MRLSREAIQIPLADMCVWIATGELAKVETRLVTVAITPINCRVQRITKNGLRWRQVLQEVVFPAICREDAKSGTRPYRAACNARLAICTASHRTSKCSFGSCIRVNMTAMFYARCAMDMSNPVLAHEERTCEGNKAG